MRKCIEEYFCTRVALGEKQIALLTPILVDLFESVRRIMNVHNYGGKFTSRFNLLLSRYCRLSPNYHALRQRVLAYVGGQTVDVNALFDDLYAESSCYEHVR